MEGLRFECQPGCTACCSAKGYVYLSERDLERAADFLGLTKPVFERRYVYRTRHLLRLRKPRGSECHFLGEGGCSIHPAKPTQCRAYPFWPEHVGKPAAWRKVQACCPGIGQGDYVPLQAVQRIANEMREAYPGIYSAE
ncbi:MAG: YkgJ family cysteine cluster protein [Bryobacteraceae bacterium]